MGKHERIYAILLTVFAFYLLTSIGTFVLVACLLGSGKDASRNVIGAAMYHMVYITACLLVFVLTALVLRFARPAAGRIVTKALNIVLLLGFPLGTALGIYGLWKVDRDRSKKPPEADSR